MHTDGKRCNCLPARHSEAQGASTMENVNVRSCVLIVYIHIVIVHTDTHTELYCTETQTVKHDYVYSYC